MMNRDGTGFEMDCVYKPDGNASELRNARIKLELVGDGLELTVSPEVEMSGTELQSVLDIIQREYFRKMKLTLSEDCRIYVTYGGERFRAVMDGRHVSGLERQDDYT